MNINMNIYLSQQPYPSQTQTRHRHIYLSIYPSIPLYLPLKESSFAKYHSTNIIRHID